MKNIIISGLVLSLCLITTGNLRSQECDCSDFNCDGIWNASDAVYLMDYLFGGGPPPVNGELWEVDWDGYQTLTVNDIVLIWHYIFSEGWPWCPPPNPALAPEVDSAYAIYYTDYIPPGTGSAAIQLTLNTPYPFNTGYSLPLRIRVDGNIPTIDSVTSDSFVFPSYAGMYTVYPDSGCLALGIVDLWSGGNARQIVTIHLTVPVEPNIQYVTMEWINLPPMQAPVPDSTVIPMLTSWYGGGVEPLLIGHCCTNPGDANEDGAVNVGDAVHLINCIFVDCPPPFCESHHDANCDGNANIGDAVYLINYVFKGGPAPCCL